MVWLFVPQFSVMILFRRSTFCWLSVPQIRLMSFFMDIYVLLTMKTYLKILFTEVSLPRYSCSEGLGLAGSAFARFL